MTYDNQRRIIRKVFRILFYLIFVGIALYYISVQRISTVLFLPEINTSSAHLNKKSDVSRINATLHKYVFNASLWRPTDEFPGDSAVHYNDRILEQNEWALNYQPTQIKRIALPGGFESVFQTKDSLNTLLSKNCPNLVNYCEFFDASHFKELSGVDVAIINYASNRTVPKGDYMKAYFLLESSYLASATLRGTDLLSSFWSGSDITYAYGKWTNYEHPREPRFQSKRNYAYGKSKMAAMFSSNCGNVHNGRMKFVEELRKSGVSVDIYGKCGTHTCPREKKTECYAMLKADYKFYLAFENSNCRDYITEKFFRNALKNDVVPVVMGAPLEDFIALTPPNSYIHVDTFASIPALAEHMLSLDKDDVEYNKYFEWKWKEAGKIVDQNFFCRFCGMMHYADFVPFPVRKKDLIYGMDDMEGANYTIKPCLARNRFYWNSPN